jgi:nitrate/nitrite transporter NarK
MLDIGRGALVILAGYAAMVVLVIVSSVLLAVAFPGPTAAEPSQAYIAGNLVCGLLAAIAGGWVTGRLAAQRPLLHVSVLAAIVIGLGILLMTSESRDAAAQPAWYPAVIVVIGAVGAFLGGLIAAMRREKIHP